MSWMAKLYDTYDYIEERCNKDGITDPWPISHFVKNAHLEVVINNTGDYLQGRTKILNGIDSPTLIPASESSAGRSGAKIAPHPICDEIGYCASDYPKRKKEKTKAYMEQLSNWAESDKSHPKLLAIYQYLSKNTLWKDLSNDFEFPLKIKKVDGTSQKIATEKVFIRWRVEEAGNPVSGTWEDKSLINSWIAYDNEHNTKDGFCSVLGNDSRIALNHPRFLRRPGDGAKLISSNDSSGFTFRGRFTDTKTSIEKNGIQAVGIGFDLTQKAHNALRWLIASQGMKIGSSRDDAGSVVLAWAVSATDIPQPMEDTWDCLWNEEKETSSSLPTIENQINHTIDIGQSFAHELGKFMAGYRANLKETDNIIIMGLDSATPGRMAITYYQELFPDEYIARISQWHKDFAWYQRHKSEEDAGKKKTIYKTIWVLSSPSPRAIWETIYGTHLTDSLKKNTVERLLPCIIEARPFPRDLVLKAVQKVSNRSAYKSDEQWLWEKHLGVACALYKGFCKRNPTQTKEYDMALEDNNDSRDYLYGRLLAIAERIEEIALSVSGENRSTTAARLMQRFSDHPASTWRNIELALQPYIQRLKNNRAGFLHNMQQLLDEVMEKFLAGDFVNDKSLSGEFLLAYHCQRLVLRNKSQSTEQTEDNN